MNWSDFLLGSVAGSAYATIVLVILVTRWSR